MCVQCVAQVQCVCVCMYKFGLQDCIQLSKVLLNLCLSEIKHFCIGQYTTNTCVFLFRSNLTTLDVIFKDLSRSGVKYDTLKVQIWTS